MKVFNTYKNFCKEYQTGSSIAIGNFDGVHLGHLKIINKALDEAKDKNLLSGIFTFKNHPKNIIAKNKIIEEILSTAQRIKIFTDMGLDFCIMLDETEDFFTIEPDDFVETVLIKQLNAKVITVGENFHFGHISKGKSQDLQSKQYSQIFKTIIEPLIKIDDEIVSSTNIRKAIKNFNFKKANHLLGKNIFLEATVIKGKQIGTQIGFPTANIKLESENLFETGVYIANSWLKNIKYASVINIGYCPTISNYNEKKIEIHLINYKSSNFYGQNLIFQIKDKIRKELKFNSKLELKDAIKQDIKIAEELLKK